MPRMQILTETEREEFESPPIFSSPERKRYFHIPPSLEAILATLRTETNQVLWVLQLGCFKATGRFFASRFHAADVEYVASKLGFLPGIVAVEEYDSKATGAYQISGKRECGEIEAAARSEVHEGNYGTREDSPSRGGKGHV